MNLRAKLAERNNLIESRYPPKSGSPALYVKRARAVPKLFALTGQTLYVRIPVKQSSNSSSWYPPWIKNKTGKAIIHQEPERADSARSFR